MNKPCSSCSLRIRSFFFYHWGTWLIPFSKLAKISITLFNNSYSCNLNSLTRKDSCFSISIKWNFLLTRVLVLCNIAEARFKNCWTLMSVLYDDVQMDQETSNNTKVWHLCGNYENIYDWISGYWIKPSDLWFLLTHRIILGEIWWIWSLAYFHFFDASLNDAFQLQCFHCFIFRPYQRQL